MDDRSDREPTSGEQLAEELTRRASDAVIRRLQKLELDPELVQWGQEMANVALNGTSRVRKSLQTEPLLAGTGLVAIAAGGVMLAMALMRGSRDTRALPSPRGKTGYSTRN
jgi:hypothetical protein